MRGKHRAFIISVVSHIFIIKKNEERRSLFSCKFSDIFLGLQKIYLTYIPEMIILYNSSQ